jgi:hypothetical protein
MNALRSPPLYDLIRLMSDPVHSVDAGTSHSCVPSVAFILDLTTSTLDKESEPQKYPHYDPYIHGPFSDPYALSHLATAAQPFEPSPFIVNNPTISDTMQAIGSDALTMAVTGPHLVTGTTPVPTEQATKNLRKRPAPATASVPSTAPASKKRRTNQGTTQPLDGIGPSLPPPGEPAARYPSVIQRSNKSQTASTICHFWSYIVAIPTQEDEGDRDNLPVLTGPPSKDLVSWIACRLCSPSMRGSTGKR